MQKLLALADRLLVALLQAGEDFSPLTLDIRKDCTTVLEDLKDMLQSFAAAGKITQAADNEDLKAAEGLSRRISTLEITSIKGQEDMTQAMSREINSLKLKKVCILGASHAQLC